MCLGREEKESEVCVTAKPDRLVTGAESSSQNDKFPHPPITSLCCSHTCRPPLGHRRAARRQIEPSSRKQTHLEEARLCVLSWFNVTLKLQECPALKNSERA